MSENSAPAAPLTSWMPVRRNGKSMHELYGPRRDGRQWGAVAVMFKLPKVYTETYGGVYMVTDLTPGAHAAAVARGETASLTFDKRAQAKAYAESLLAS